MNKINIKLKILFILIILAFLSCGQNSKTEKGNGTSGSLKSKIFNPKDDLIGDFAMKPNGKPELRITKENGSYFAQTFENEKWTKQKQLENVKDSDFQELFGKDWRNYVEAGLHKDIFGIFKIKKGYKTKDHTFETGYFMFFLIPADIYKLD